jgi:hypothetical protein
LAWQLKVQGKWDILGDVSLRLSMKMRQRFDYMLSWEDNDAADVQFDSTFIVASEAQSDSMRIFDGTRVVTSFLTEMLFCFQIEISTAFSLNGTKTKR